MTSPTLLGAVAGLLLAAIVAIGCGSEAQGSGARQAASPNPAPAAQAPPRAPAAPPGAGVAETPPDGTLVVAGRVAPKPELTMQVVAPIWGTMEFAAGPIAPGDRVRKGQPLVRLILELSADERYPMLARKVEIESALAVARVRKARAETEYKSALALMKLDPENKLLQAQVRAAESLFQAASEEQTLYERQEVAYQQTLKRRDPRITVVEAPIDGVLTEVNVRPGTRNMTGEFKHLCTIVNLSRVWLEAEVFEGHLGQVLNGGRAAYRVAEGEPAHPLGAPVAVLPWVDEKTRTVKVVFEVPNTDNRFRLGMSVQIEFDGPAPAGAMTERR